MELEVYTTNVELQDIPSYTTSITLEGQLLRLSFLWNERIGKRILSIKNSADECYLQNTILHPNEPFELNANAVLNDLPYSATLIKTGDQKRVGNIFNWSKDFILCFSRTVDVDVEKLNVVYGVTEPSTPILPPPYGDWILNQGYEIIGNDIKYTAYKTNGLNYYDSFALADLIQALVKSFHDPDLQQYSAFTSAVEQLVGAVDWVLDPANNQIKWNETVEVPIGSAYWQTQTAQSTVSAADACQKYLTNLNQGGASYYKYTFNSVGSYYNVSPDRKNFDCIPYMEVRSTGEKVQSPSTFQGALVGQSAVEGQEQSIPLDVVAQQVISNAESSEDEVLKLLSEDYINLVAESIENTDTAKQFVKLEDLIPQLEANKVLRN